LSSAYVRYHLEGVPAPDLAPGPPRFRVKVRKLSLARLLLRELLQYRANLGVVLSRPCVYGVFSGPLGGFAPRERLCVGCLRCTVEYPEVVQIHPDAERERLGDSFLGPDDVDAILYEARTGRVPVRGAGYRGRFGGEGWDGIWTDMSELLHALADAALRLDTLALVPARWAGDPALRGPHVVPVLSPPEWGAVNDLDPHSRMLELDGWDPVRFAETVRRFPGSLVAVRVPAEADVLGIVRDGARVIHLVADYHGAAAGFFGDAIRSTHRQLVEAGVREEVTLLGSGGIARAEHLAKAIICGLDAGALDVAVCVALQGRFEGEARDRGSCRVRLPRLDPRWAAQRIVNLAASWRDQLLEVLGAMGLREVRRLRGELGRALFQSELERDAFAGIRGYEPRA